MTVALSYRELRNDLVAAPGMDDKVGVWTVMEALRLLQGRPVQAAVYCVSTVQEEIGLRGRHNQHLRDSAHGRHCGGCHPLRRHARQRQETTGRHAAGCGSGGVPRAEHQPARLRALARNRSRSRDSAPGARRPRATGTDANTMQLSRDGVATGLIGIPNRYMHSPVEVVCLTDMDRAARLLAEFCANLTPEIDWTP